jgi:hypothetical protein
MIWGRNQCDIQFSSAPTAGSFLPINHRVWGQINLDIQYGGAPTAGAISPISHRVWGQSMVDIRANRAPTAGVIPSNNPEFGACGRLQSSKGTPRRR